jgi:hypothetical protein
MKKNASYMSDLEYWTARVEETDKAIDAYRIKMYTKVLPLSIEEEALPLSIEDQYPLLDLLVRQNSYIYHLKNAVTKLKEDDNKSLFRKLFDRG